MSSVVVAAVLGAVLMVSCVPALCPANGNTFMVYVSVNGQRGESTNLATYDTNGRFLGGALNASGLRMEKLRGLFVDPKENTLWVANTQGEESEILVFAPPVLSSSCRRPLSHLFISSGDSNPLMRHPYGLKFSPDRSILYCSNQNTVTITRYYTGYGTAESKAMAGQPLPPVDGVLQLPGAFVTAENSRGYTINSIRGIAANADYILVADVASGELLVFEAATGAFAWDYDRRIRSPVQPILVENPLSRTPTSGKGVFIYVTTKAPGVGVYKAELAANGLVAEVITGNFEATSGLIGLGSHRLFLADRVARRVSIYRDDGLLLGRFAKNLPDDPEFLAVSSAVSPSVIPFCHELDIDGNFKLSVLCIGGAFWLLMTVPAALWLARWIAPLFTQSTIASSIHRHKHH